MRHRAPLAALALLAAPAAADQDRPREEDIFGKAEAPEQTKPPPRPEEGQLLGNGSPRGSPPPEPRPREDPLKIGGQLYLRALGQWQQDVPPADWSLAAPALVDGYLDVRPNDRVRGFLLARLQYDLARATSGSSAPAPPIGSPGAASGSGTSLFALQSQNPRVLLDQLWINFDVQRTVFVTAGKQHVKWGAARFWNPTDFLHPVRRDPLAVFDARTGLTMVKLQLPWEKMGWNLYGVGFLDEAQPVGTVGAVGGAARAEVVLGSAEFGVDGLAERGRDARLGLGFSAGSWDPDA
jgi:hypothetical protein